MRRDYHHIKLDFRMIALTEEQLEKLKSEVSSVRKLKIGQNYKNPKLFVASFRIQKGKQYDDLCMFLKKTKISKDSYGLWISILTTKTSAGVRIPKHVLKLYEKTGGLIDFSFDSG